MIRSSAHSSAGAGSLPSRRPPRPAAPSLRSRVGWIVLGVVLGAVVLWAARGVLPVLLASAALGYLFDRPVSWLARRGVGRERAVGLLFALLASLVVLLVAVVVPLVGGQLSQLSANIGVYLSNLAALVAPYKDEIEARLGVPLPVDLADLATVAPQYLERVAAIPNASTVAGDVLARVAGGGLQLLLALLTLSLVPLFTFYVASAWPTLVERADELVPPRNRPLVRRVAKEIDTRTIAFVEGQALLCLVMGVLYSLGLLVCRVDLAVVVGMLSGLLFVIPYVGTAAGAVVAATLALLKFGFDWHVIGAVGTYAVVQGLEGAVLTPAIVGNRVGLHPMVVMVGVVVFGNLLGVWGLLLAVPLTAALEVLARELLAAWRGSATYTHP